MTPVTAAWSGRVRQVYARSEQLLGRSGLAGVVLLVASLGVFLSAWRTHTETPPAGTLAARPTLELANNQGGRAVPALAEPPVLSPMSDVPLLLTQVKLIFINNGLGWPAADYRVMPATDALPASLEVSSTVKAPYPQLRSMLSQVLSEVPHAGIRELSFSRPSGDVATIEAKVRIAVMLSDSPLVSQEASRTPEADQR